MSTIHDLPSDVRQRHHNLVMKGFTEALGRKLEPGDFGRMKVNHAQGSLTDLLMLDGKQIGKVEHTNDGTKHNVRLIMMEDIIAN